MANEASKQQTTALFLTNIVTWTRKHTEQTKNDKPDEKSVLCQGTSISIFCAVFYTGKQHRLTYSVWGPLNSASENRCTLIQSAGSNVPTT
jgi:hypothetical protein